MERNFVGLQELGLEWPVKLLLGLILRIPRIGVGVLLAEGARLFRDKAVLFKNVLCARSRRRAHREPVAHPVLVNADLPRIRFTVGWSPDTEFFEMASVKFLFDRLRNEPPVSMTMQGLVQQLNSHTHVAVYNK